MSIDGMRHVTGRLEPAMNGKPILSEVSYICLAHSHFHERCLSLNSGTLRPLATGITRPWATRHDRLSQRYTTRVEEMLVATAW